jgi:hypothetical protein
MSICIRGPIRQWQARLAGLRGLEPADVISRMFIAAHGRKVSGLTTFAETKNNSGSISVAYRKMTFASSSPLSPGMQSGLREQKSPLPGPVMSAALAFRVCKNRA